MSRRLLSLIAAVACTTALAACTEHLESGAGCPLLCPQPAIELRDTVIDAVILDSTLAGFPAIGFEESLLLASRGDTLETRVIVRFDSLPTTYHDPQSAQENEIVHVDSASLIVRLVYPLADPTTQVTVLAYDVDVDLPPNSAADTTVATLAPLFRADRLLGSVTVVPSQLTDSTLRIPLSNERLLEKLTEGARLRIGLAIQAEQSASLVLFGQGDASTLAVRFRVDEDTLVPPVLLVPLSRTPDDVFTARALADYQVAIRGTPPPPAGTVLVGGVPGHRTYLRFDLPRRITDSSRVVRAALLLTQAPNPASPRRADTVTVLPDVIIASENITNLERAARFTSRTFVAGNTLASIPPLSLVPSDSGLRTVEMAALIAAWSGLPRDDVPRALVLRTADENRSGAAILFYSREAPPEVRPRLRLTYAPRLEFGLP